MPLNQRSSIPEAQFTPMVSSKWGPVRNGHPGHVMPYGRKRSAVILEDVPEKGLESGTTSAGEEGESIACLQNCVYYYADVTTANVLKLLQKLHEANEYLHRLPEGADRKVYLYIHSAGGEVFAGFSAMDHIWWNRYPIVTIADGYVASAATFLLLGGTERQIHRNARLLIHQLTAGLWGQFADLCDEMKNNQDLMETAKRIYIAETEMRKAQVEKLLQQSSTSTRRRRSKYGFVDEVW